MKSMTSETSDIGKVYYKRNYTYLSIIVQNEERYLKMIL